MSIDPLYAEFVERFPTSLERHQQAADIFANGVTHDGRYFSPFPLYVDHAAGSRKWDLDGNELIDYWMGHGALLLGHNPPTVVQAVTEQIGRGTHYGACHELEIEWGNWVKKLIPSAERVRFVSSGTEATLMAIRLARGFTGRKKLIRFQGHFHGWHDEVVVGIKAPFDRPTSVGIPEENLARLIILPPNDADAVEQALQADPDIAGLILEPAGGSNALIPTRPGFLAALRELCTAHGVVLIFDEVISGFRYAPGGAQEYFGVLPDLTTLAKIVSGGLPGGAVAGRAEIMDLIAFKADPQADRYERMMHTGTFNANPLSAAAGIAILKIAATGEPQKQAGGLTLRLIDGMNDILRRKKLPGCVYGDISGFHLLVGQPDFTPDDASHILDADPTRLTQGMGKLTQAVRAALLLEGIDTSGASGRFSSAHTEEDLAQTLSGFERALDRLLRWEVF